MNLFGGDIKVDLSNYATKTDLKDAAGIDTSNFALKSNLASLKTEKNKIDVGKLKTVPVDVVKKTVYDKLVSKVHNIDISRFVLKTQYDTNKLDLEKKIPDTSGLAKKTDYNAKITEIEGKILNITGLATTFALPTVENKIPAISSLVKTTDYNAKISDIEKKVTDHDHEKYITTSEFNKLTKENFAAILAQVNLVTKTDFDAKLISLNKKIDSNKTKHLLA